MVWPLVSSASSTIVTITAVMAVLRLRYKQEPFPLCRHDARMDDGAGMNTKKATK